MTQKFIMSGILLEYKKKLYLLMNQVIAINFISSLLHTFLYLLSSLKRGYKNIVLLQVNLHYITIRKGFNSIFYLEIEYSPSQCSVKQKEKTFAIIMPVT